MAATWEILSEFKVSEKQNNYNLVRVCKIGNSALMLDIRTYAFNRPTKIGVAFHLPEIKWVLKVLDKSGEGSLGRTHRSIILTKLWYGTRFTVEKKNTRQEICLEQAEIDVLKASLEKIIPLMETESVAMELPVDFTVGEKIDEKIVIF